MQVFISYRRADSQVMAGRIAQFLDAVPAVDRVFLDVDDIAPGEDFERRIQERLRHASHVFVLVGRGVLLLLAALANRVLSDDCYDVVCRLRRSLGLGSDADALGVLWILALGVLAVAILVPFMARIARPLRRRL